MGCTRHTDKSSLALSVFLNIFVPTFKNWKISHENPDGLHLWKNWKCSTLSPQSPTTTRGVVVTGRSTSARGTLSHWPSFLPLPIVLHQRSESLILNSCLTLENIRVCHPYLNEDLHLQRRKLSLRIQTRQWWSWDLIHNTSWEHPGQDRGERLRERMKAQSSSWTQDFPDNPESALDFLSSWSWACGGWRKASQFDWHFESLRNPDDFSVRWEGQITDP